MNLNESVYLDTSVISARFDIRLLPRLEETKKFFDKLTQTTIFISPVVVQELKLISDDGLRNKVLTFIKPFYTLRLSDEVEMLAEDYIEESIIPPKYLSDALHLAFASVNNINVLVSWNFEHLVKRKTKLLVNYVNALKGYKPIEIVSPLDF